MARCVVRRDRDFGHGRAGKFRLQCLEILGVQGQVGDSSHRDDTQRVTFGNGRQPRHALRVRDHDPAAAVLDAVVQFLGGPPGIHRHRHRANRDNGDKRHHPLRVVAAGDGHPVPRAHSKLALQGGAQGGTASQGFGEAVALLAVDDKIPLAVVLHQRAVGAEIRRHGGIAQKVHAVDHHFLQRKGLAIGGESGDCGRVLFQCRVHGNYYCSISCTARIR